MQHTLLTTCYAYMSRVCVFVDVCVVSVTLSLSLSSCPLLLSSAGWLVIRWREVECDSVIIRADMCRWPRDVSACWDFWGNSAISHTLSLRPSFSSATNIPADICFPSSLQSLWCLLGLRVCESDLIFRSGSFITWVTVRLWGCEVWCWISGRCVKIQSVIDTRPHWLHLTQTGTAPVLRNVHPCDKSEDKQGKWFQSHCTCLSVLVVQVSSW